MKVTCPRCRGRANVRTRACNLCMTLGVVPKEIAVLYALSGITSPWREDSGFPLIKDEDVTKIAAIVER